MSEDRFLENVLAMRGKLYRVAMAILWNEQDAADAVQEAMLKGWKRRGSLRDEAAFGAWFLQILVRQCRDMQRKQIRRRRLLGDLENRRGTAVQSAGPALQPGELFEAIHELPDALRLPLLLCYFDGYSQKEAGAILGATPAQIKDRVRRAREKLRRALDEGGDAE